jgi:hypothetical protein
MVNPYFIIGTMIAVAGAYGYGHHTGWADRDAEMQAEIAKLNEKSRETEQALTQTLNDKTNALRKAKDEISKKQSDAYKLIDTGRLRLPVPATPSCVPATPDTAVANGDRGEERPDPYREAIKAVVALAIEGDRNTVQLNACIDTYNEVREKINGKR